MLLLYNNYYSITVVLEILLASICSKLYPKQNFIFIRPPDTELFPAVTEDVIMHAPASTTCMCKDISIIITSIEEDYDTTGITFFTFAGYENLMVKVERWALKRMFNIVARIIGASLSEPHTCR